jgi:hypothetical protein
MKITIAHCAVILVLVISCKRKPENLPDTPPPETTSNVSVAEKLYHGIITTEIRLVQAYGPLTTQSLIAAFLYSVTMKYYGIDSPGTYYVQDAPGVFSGIVSLNGDSLLFESYRYYVQKVPADLSRQHWEFSGNDVISAFAFSDSLSAPVGPDINAIPGIISKSMGVILPLTGIENIKAASVFIKDGYTATSIHELDVDNPVVAFSPSQLSEISGECVFHIRFTNYQIITIGGKNFRFNRNLDIRKLITLVQ